MTENVRCSHPKYIRLDPIFNRVGENPRLGERPILPKLVSEVISAFGGPNKPHRASVQFGADTYNGSGVSVACTVRLCLTLWDSRARNLSKMKMHPALTRWFDTLVGTGRVDHQGLTKDLGQDGQSEGRLVPRRMLHAVWVTGWLACGTTSSRRGIP